MLGFRHPLGALEGIPCGRGSTVFARLQHSRALPIDLWLPAQGVAQAGHRLGRTCSYSREPWLPAGGRVMA